jgi:hypothetical protein
MFPIQSQPECHSITIERCEELFNDYLLHEIRAVSFIRFGKIRVMIIVGKLNYQL